MTQRRCPSTLLLCAAFLLPLAACKHEQPPMPKGNMAVALALPTLDGGEFDPAVLSGKKVILNFWAPT